MPWEYLSRSSSNEASNNKRSREDDECRRAGHQDDDSVGEDSRCDLLRSEASQNVHLVRGTNPKSNERSKRMRDSVYGKGLLLTLFGGAGLCEHITSGRGSFPVSAVVLGIGLILIVFSYEKNNH